MPGHGEEALVDFSTRVPCNRGNGCCGNCPAATLHRAQELPIGFGRSWVCPKESLENPVFHQGLWGKRGLLDSFYAILVVTKTLGLGSGLVLIAFCNPNAVLDTLVCQMALGKRLISFVSTHVPPHFIPSHCPHLTLPHHHHHCHSFVVHPHHADSHRDDALCMPHCVGPPLTTSQVLIRDP